MVELKRGICALQPTSKVPAPSVSSYTRMEQAAEEQRGTPCMESSSDLVFDSLLEHVDLQSLPVALKATSTGLCGRGDRAVRQQRCLW